VKDLARVLILGGGFGGLACAHELRSLLDDSHTITIVDREEGFRMGLSLPWIVQGRRTPEDTVRSYDNLPSLGIELINGEITAINPNEQEVRVGDQNLDYDQLVIALGASFDTSSFKEFGRSAINMYDFKGAQYLRKEVRGISRGRFLISIFSMPFKCPPAPYEYAFIVDEMLRERGVRKDVALYITTPEPYPLPIAPREVGAKLETMLKERDIIFKANREAELLEPNVLHFKDGSRRSFDVLAAVPPHRAPSVVKEAGLIDDSGWVPVDPRTLETSTENVYAIGDVNIIKLPDGKAIPKAGVFAENEGISVARAIASRLSGTEKSDFAGEGDCIFYAGQDEAIKADARFYQDAKNWIVMHGPSAEFVQEKDEFENARMDKWLGPID